MIKNTNITETHVKINFKERNQTFDSSLQNLCLIISTFNTYHVGHLFFSLQYAKNHPEILDSSAEMSF